MDRRVELRLPARQAQLNRESARAEQARHFGSEVAIATGRVVNNDLGVRDSFDTRRLPRRVTLAMKAAQAAQSATLPA
jgi:hypothetical protein